MWFRIARTRQGARTDPFPVRGSDQSLHYESDPNWDPLTDTFFMYLQHQYTLKEAS
jgi:hypothetical protein